MIRRDRHQRDKKTGNKEDIDMATKQCTEHRKPKLNGHAGITPSYTDGIERMLCRLIKEQSVPDVRIKEFDVNPLNFNYF